MAEEKEKLTNLAEELQQSAEKVEEGADEKSADARIASLVKAGASLVALGDHEKGITCLRSAITAISARETGESQSDQEGKLRETLAEIHYNSAVASHALGDYAEAAQDYQCFINISEKSGELETTVDALQALASCYREAGREDDEISSLKRAREMCRQLVDSGREAMTCASLARTHLRAGREAECRQMLSTAKLLGLRSKDTKTLRLLYSQCGLIHTSLGQHDEALRSFEQALTLVRSGESSDGQEASLLQNMGAAYNEKKMYSESLVYHREAASIHGRLENYEGEIKSLYNLATAQSQMEDYTSASTTLLKALEKARLVNNVELQFQALESLGSCYYHTGLFSDAERAFSDALGLLSNRDTGSRDRDRVSKKLSVVKVALLKDQQPTNPIPASTQQSPPHSGPSTPLGREGREGTPSKESSFVKQLQETRASQSTVKEQELGSGIIRSNSQDSCTRQIQAYEEALSSGHESSEPDGLPPDILAETQELTASNPPSIIMGQDPKLSITEGSLAIGANAREMYTVEKGSRHTERGQGKRRTHRTVPTLGIVMREQRNREGVELTANDTRKLNTLEGSHNLNSAQHSKTCTIL